VQIIPVIDLKNGLVVRGVAGRRELYRPVESVLNCEATPRSVANAFASNLGFRNTYVADLDAIAGIEPNWEAYDSIGAAGLRLLIDAGTSSVSRALAFKDRSSVDSRCDGVVIGLESLVSRQDLPDLVAGIGAERAIFSLDIRGGQPITAIPAWNGAQPLEIVDEIIVAGFERLIILDIASVGVGEGVSVIDLCAQIRERHPRLQLISGGGVRGVADLAALASVGCDAALVASALHDGRLSKDDLAHFA